VTSSGNDFAAAVAEGRALTRGEAEALLSNPDLLLTGTLGEQARVAITGRQVTYARVLSVSGDFDPTELGEACEVRLIGTPVSAEIALARVRSAAGRTGSAALTGFSLADLLDLAGHDHLALADLSRALAAAGLEAVAEAPLDLIGDLDHATEVVRAAQHGGLAVRRLTVSRASLDARLPLIELACQMQDALGTCAAFAPLPRLDPADIPATGYDDVRTVAAARLMCRNIRSIQVDWPLYGPKLAQVAIAYGANDIDGIAPTADPSAGHRRSPKEDIERQIRAAGAEPAERDARYDVTRAAGSPAARANGAGLRGPRE
jgi:hypothetical protein